MLQNNVNLMRDPSRYLGSYGFRAAAPFSLPPCKCRSDGLLLLLWPFA